MMKDRLLSYWIIEVLRNTKTNQATLRLRYFSKRVYELENIKKIYKLCDEVGIPRCSTHKIRKTILSELVNVCLGEGISDLSAIREFAGHVDESILLKEYVFSTKRDERRALVEQALSPKPWTQD